DRENVGRTAQLFGEEKQWRRFVHLMCPPGYNRGETLQFAQVDDSYSAKNIQVRSARPEVSTRRGTVQDHGLQILAAGFLQASYQFSEFAFHHCHSRFGNLSTTFRLPPRRRSRLRQILRSRRLRRPSLR